MKKACFLLACALAALTLPAQVVISPNNPANPHASAMLDVQSTDKGMLVPRMTTAQRTAIANPAKGLLVFDTNTNTFWFYNGSAWGPVDGNTVPSTGIILSETENNPALTAAGFSLIGETKMLVKPTGGTGSFAWTGETALDGAPSPRWKHTAVWTGTEMIIWGGSNLDSCSMIGGRYTPSTNTWIGTSSNNSPAARTGHTAIWTGTEMIIWGGQNCTGMTIGSGGRYNPSTDTWIPISTTNAPDPRSLHTAIWTGTEMIVWGGIGNNGAYIYDTGCKYNPTTDTWTPVSTTNAPSARFWHTAVWTGTEMIVWGGNYPPTDNTGGRYNPVADTWNSTTTVNAPSPRYGHTAIWNGTEVIIWGGNGYGGNNSLTALATGRRYNPMADVWVATSTSNVPSSREGHTAVWTGAEMIIWGGAGAIPALKTGGRYVPSTNTWKQTPLFNVHESKYGHTTVWTGEEMIVWGGEDINSSTNTGGILSFSEHKTLYLFQKN